MTPIAQVGHASARATRVRNAPATAGATARPGTVRELYTMLLAGGRWWLVPMIGVLGVTALLLAMVTAIEYVAPFVYTIF